MKNIIAKKFWQVPKLYETENVPVKDKLICLHFFNPTSDWYVAEFDGKNLFFGFVILNHDLENSEWGYFSLDELSQIGGIFKVHDDSFWCPKRFEEIDLS